MKNAGNECIGNKGSQWQGNNGEGKNDNARLGDEALPALAVEVVEVGLEWHF